MPRTVLLDQVKGDLPRILECALFIPYDRGTRDIRHYNDAGVHIHNTAE